MASRGGSTFGGDGSKVISDMDEHTNDSENMRADARKAAQQAIEQVGNGELSDVARYVKEFFDNKYGLTWHCVVGNDFRAFVTHESKTFIFFYLGKNAIMLYKAG
jgi:dynein light chain LC8-type|tara:strand:+ start:242 stop:556 length:315 start_codon:yes stop_codon:yes gene_type:complete